MAYSSMNYNSMESGAVFNFNIQMMDEDGYWNTFTSQHTLEAYQAIAVMSLHHEVKRLNGEVQKERKAHQETKRKLDQRDSLLNELKTKCGEMIDETKDEKIFKMKKEMLKMAKNMKKMEEEMEEAKAETKKTMEEKEKMEKVVEDHKMTIRNMIKEKFGEPVKVEKPEEPAKPVVEEEKVQEVKEEAYEVEEEDQYQGVEVYYEEDVYQETTQFESDSYESDYSDEGSCSPPTSTVFYNYIPMPPQTTTYYGYQPQIPEIMKEYPLFMGNGNEFCLINENGREGMYRRVNGMYRLESEVKREQMEYYSQPSGYYL